MRISFLQPQRDDDADFSIKVRSDERQRQLSARAQTRDYWKIPIRPAGQLAHEASSSQDPQWAEIRRRRAPDARANTGSDGAAVSHHASVDPLALEEAASADGLQVLDAKPQN